MSIIYEGLAVLPWEKNTLKFGFENEFGSCTYKVRKGWCKIFAILSQNGSDLQHAYGYSREKYGKDFMKQKQMQPFLDCIWLVYVRYLKIKAELLNGDD